MADACRDEKDVGGWRGGGEEGEEFITRSEWARNGAKCT